MLRRWRISFLRFRKLLRAGAEVIVSTRFPRDSAARYAAEPDFEEWGQRLEIFGLDLRHTPSVAFFLDAVPENAGQIEELLEKARMADAEVAKAAAGAKPAGDADPYKRKDDDEDEQE